MSAAKDKSGAWLDGGKHYTLHVPSNVPAKELWAVTVFDAMTRSMIKMDTMSASVASHNSLQLNTDGPPTSTSTEAAFRWRKRDNDQSWTRLVCLLPMVWSHRAFFDNGWTLQDIKQR